MCILRSLIQSILLLSLHYTCDSEQTYFIKATEYSPCAAQPCLTLSKFTNTTTKSGIVLQFGAGNHTLYSRHIFSNIEKCSIFSKDNSSLIVCSEVAAGFTFKNVSIVTLTNLTFIRCGNASRYNPVLHIFRVNDANISTCVFLHSKGRVIEAAYANITTKYCSFESCSAGVIILQHNTTMLDIGGIYTLNTFSPKRSALVFIIESIANFINSRFYKNRYNAYVRLHTIIYYVKGGTLTLRQCELAHNNAELLISHDSTIVIYDSNLTHNFAGRRTSLLSIFTTNLSINNGIFAHNIYMRQLQGAIIFIDADSTVKSNNTLTIINNTCISYCHNSYALDIRSSRVTFERVNISDNTGSMAFLRSKVEFTELKFQHARIIHPYIPLHRDAITSVASIIIFQGTTSFCNQHRSTSVAQRAVYARESRIYANGDTLFSNNTGGALYLDQSDFICKKNCTFIGNTASKGGGIYAINSIITMGSDWNKFKQNKKMRSLLSFDSNSADEGGAIYLEGNSKLRTPREVSSTYELEFHNNTAKRGGAIFVNDYTSICANSTCFIQAQSYKNGWIKINSTNGNTTIYGGLLDRCIAKRKYIRYNTMIGINYFARVSNDTNIKSMITSDPVRVCYCHNRSIDCNNYTHPIVNVKRGGTFNVTVVAVDQVNHITDASVFIKSTSNYTYRLGIEQRVQKVYNGCSNLTLNVFSPNDSIELILYATGPCQDIGISKFKLPITFKKCTCPIGFQPLATKDDCSCGCDQQIKALVKTCNQSSESLLRQGDFWLNSITGIDTIHYLIYPHCPFDYCVPSIYSTYVNLNTPNGADAQCALNRTGLLCSSCKPGLSLSLGSSRCLQCPKDWQKLFIAITMGAVASGIALVVITLVLNLTTAVGTLNGLIFYINIVASNNITYNHMSKPNVFSVFIAWLNLELGLDTCFYNGLDSYSKAWLQFVFPAYLIILLIIVILMSKYSSRFAKLIGKRNPIATLTTVILLSYMKLLRNTKDIFSVAVLRYPDGLQRRWLPDANIKYLHDKHIPLFLVAAIIVFIGLFYTALLLTWQWLLQVPHYKWLGWIRNTRLNLFMEANLAAYNSKHRYWSGLLLLIRVALYFEIALDTTNRRSNNLLATGIICTCLLFIKTLSGIRVYKNKLIDCFNSFCYVNLLILSIIYHSNRNERMIAAKISVSIAFLQLLCVLIYHTIITLLEIPRLGKLKLSFAKLLNKHSKLGKILPFDFQETNIKMHAMMTRTTPTSTEIGLQGSIDASAAEITEQKGEQSLTTGWEETDSLREPLLQELKV